MRRGPRGGGPADSAAAGTRGYRGPGPCISERIDIAVPEPDDAQLAPYMDGWSVDGPYRISSMGTRERTRRIESPWPQETGAYGGGTVGAIPDYAGPYGAGSGRYGEPDF